MKLTRTIAGAALVAAFAFSSNAQDLGSVSLNTVQQQIFAAQTTAASSPNTSPFPCTPVNGTPCAIPNKGQAVHTILYSAPACTVIDLRLEGSFDGTTFFVISQDATDNSPNPIGGVTGIAAVSAVGYYPVVRARILTLAGGGCAVNAFYSGTASTAPSSSQVAQQSALFRTPVTVNTVTSNAFTTITIPTPFGSSAGTIWLQCSAACAANGVVTVFVGPSDSAPIGSTQILSQSVGTVATLQRFDVPAFSTNRVFVSLTPTAASANTWTIFYNFTPPGLSSGATPPLGVQSANGATLTVSPGNWFQVSNPAAGSQATTSRAAGAAGVRHVANCISFSAGSVVAPALTALTVNLRDGASGAGNIIWTHEIVISATTGEDTPPINLCGLNIVGTAATAMTLEWSAALANLSEAVSLSGYDVGP